MIMVAPSKNMVTIPIEIARKLGVQPGFSLDWFETGKPDEIMILNSAVGDLE